MGFLEPAKLEHTCPRPDNKPLTVGTRWQCDDCLIIWQVGTEYQYNEAWKVWRKE